MNFLGLNITRSQSTPLSETKPSAGTPRKRGIWKSIRSLLSAAGSSRLTSTWVTQPKRIDAYIFQNWTRIVARCQHEAEEGDHGRKFCQLLRENVIGSTGVTLQPQITDPDGKPDQLASDAITDAFAAWSRKGVCEVTGAMSRTDVERLAITSLADTGEFFLQKCYGRTVSPWGFAVRFLDPTRLDPTHCEDRGETFIKHGIEFNKLGQPLRYWFRKENPNSIYADSWLGEYDIISANEIIHCFISEKIGQKRGLPQMRTAVGRLRMLGGFEDAAITNARVASAKMGFFRDLEGADNDEPVENEDLISDAEPGVFENIGQRELVSWNPQFPDAAIEPFTKSILRSIASGLGVSYNNLANDLTSVNFSSIRQGALDEREVWKGLQEWFISAFSYPIYLAWLEYSLLAGRIAVHGKPLRADRLEKYKAVVFNGRRWGWIDPASEITAAEKAIALKVKSRSQVIREYGGDPWNVWSEIAAEEKDMESLGLDPTVKISGDTTPGKSAKEDSIPTPAQDGEK